MEFSPERIFLNMVMTLDGKITTRDGAGSKFASQADQERMLQIRSEADAIIIGAELLLPSIYQPNTEQIGRTKG